MSFEVTARDLSELFHLTWKVVNSCRQACGEHEPLAREVASLYAVVLQLQQQAEKPNSSLHWQDDVSRDELETTIYGCRRLLKVLDRALEKYASSRRTGRARKGLFKKIQFANGEMLSINEVLDELSVHKAALSLNLRLLTPSSRGSVEWPLGKKFPGMQQSLHWMMAKINSSHDGSSLSSSHSDDERSVWKEIRRGLVRDGWPRQVVKKHKKAIRQYVKNLGWNDSFDDIPQLSSPSVHREPSEVHNRRPFTPENYSRENFSRESLPQPNYPPQPPPPPTNFPQPHFSQEDFPPQQRFPTGTPPPRPNFQQQNFSQQDFPPQQGFPLGPPPPPPNFQQQNFSQQDFPQQGFPPGPPPPLPSNFPPLGFPQQNISQPMFHQQPFTRRLFPQQTYTRPVPPPPQPAMIPLQHFSEQRFEEEQAPQEMFVIRSGSQEENRPPPPPPANFPPHDFPPPQFREDSAPQEMFVIRSASREDDRPLPPPPPPPPANFPPQQLAPPEMFVIRSASQEDHRPPSARSSFSEAAPPQQYTPPFVSEDHQEFNEKAEIRIPPPPNQSPFSVRPCDLADTFQCSEKDTWNDMMESLVTTLIDTNKSVYFNCSICKKLVTTAQARLDRSQNWCRNCFHAIVYNVLYYPLTLPSWCKLRPISPQKMADIATPKMKGLWTAKYEELRAMRGRPAGRMLVPSLEDPPLLLYRNPVVQDKVSGHTQRAAYFEIAYFEEPFSSFVARRKK